MSLLNGKERSDERNARKNSKGSTVFTVILTFRKIFINHSIGSCGHRTGLYFLWPPEKIVIKRFGTLKPLPQDLKDERQLYINEKIQEL